MPFLILVIIICMIVALFAVQNAVAVSLNLLFADDEGQALSEG